MESGVYYGWAGVDIDDTGLRKEKKGGKGKGEGGGVWGMVMSIGWNPYYKNQVRSVVRIFPASHLLCVCSAAGSIIVVEEDGGP